MLYQTEYMEDCASNNAFPHLLSSSFQLKCKVERMCLTSSSWFQEAIIAQTA